MKQILITTIVLLLSLCSIQAQQIHFTDTSNRWTSYERYYSEALDDWIYTYFDFRFDDTSFDGTHPYLLHVEDGTTYGLIVTEDTLTKKVYGTKISGSDTVAFTLYDFNTLLGDTLYIPELYPYPKEPVAHVCVVKYEDILIDGIPYRAFQMQRVDNFSTYNVIEGVGSLSGPLQPLREVSEWGPPELTCFEHNNARPVFSDLFTNACYLSVDNRQASAPTVTLAPNPASGLLHISSSQAGTYTYFIYDITGRQVYQGVLKEEVALDISSWQSGMYLVQVVNDRGSKVTKKFLKR